MIGPGQSIPGFHNVPDSVSLAAGTLIGTVADIQTWQDGNILQLEETAGTPGQSLEINFINVKSIRRVGVSMFYVGSATHWIEIQLWNYIEEAWQEIWTFSSSLGLNYRYSDLPIKGTGFIDVDGNSKMRIYHPSGGNASHDSYIDYASLIT